MTEDADDRTITYLTGLDDKQYAEELADCIMAPYPEGTAAFRSPELVRRSEAACDYLLRDRSAHVRRLHGESDPSNKQKRAGIEHFINRVAYERANLQAIIDADSARKGIARNARNPRARAMKRLAQLNMAGDVSQGTYQRLLAEEEQKDVDAKREARRQSKENARQVRRELLG